MLGIEEWYTAYCFDEAIHYWGTYVEVELDKIEGKTAKSTEAKRQAKLQELLAPEGEMPKGQFADPALMFS